MSFLTKVRDLFAKRAPLEQRVLRKQAGAEARRRILSEKADVAGVSHEQVTQQRGNLSF